MKTCCKCKQVKPLSEFNKNSSKKDGLHSSCRECMKLYLKRHYQGNKKYYKDKAEKRNKTIRDETREFINSIKEKSGCIVCGERNPACLVFHHKDPLKKDLAVSAMVSRLISIKIIKAEIAKCDILCANCHRKLHARLTQRTE